MFLTRHAHNRGTKDGHYPGQPLGIVPCPTAQAGFSQMVFARIKPGTSCFRVSHLTD